MSVRLVSITFTPRSREEITTLLREWIGASRTLHHVVTLNPEMIMEATAHAAFASVVNRADAVTADGFGITLACRFLRAAVPDRVTGNDLVRLMGALSHDVPVRVYLLGGQRGVAHRASAALLAAYPRIDIVGAESGFRANDVRLPDRSIAERIHRSGANVLLVAFGSPKQELWIDRHRDALPNLRVAIGVGSAFDYLAGIVVRAPRMFQRAGLEWLWRVAVQPWRLRRILTATVAFPLSVIRTRGRSDGS